MVSISSARFNSLSAELSIFEAGQLVDFPAIVLLPGLTCSAYRFLESLLPLAEKTRILAVEMPGHGQSISKETVSLKRLASDIMQLLKVRLRGAKICILAHSMGAKVLWALLEDFGEDLASTLLGVALVDATSPAASTSKIQADSSSGGPADLLHERLRQNFSDIASGKEAMCDKFAKMFKSGFLHSDQEFAVWQKFLADCDPPTIAHLYWENVTTDLSHVVRLMKTKHVLIVAGDATFAPQTLRQRLLTGVPPHGAHIAVLPGGTHCLFYQAELAVQLSELVLLLISGTLKPNTVPPKTLWSPAVAKCDRQGPNPSPRVSPSPRVFECRNGIWSAREDPLSKTVPSWSPQVDLLSKTTPGCLLLSERGCHSAGTPNHPMFASQRSLVKETYHVLLKSPKGSPSPTPICRRFSLPSIGDSLSFGSSPMQPRLDESVRLATTKSSGSVRVQRSQSWVTERRQHGHTCESAPHTEVPSQASRETSIRDQLPAIAMGGSCPASACKNPIPSNEGQSLSREPEVVSQHHMHSTVKAALEASSCQRFVPVSGAPGHEISKSDVKESVASTSAPLKGGDSAARHNGLQLPSHIKAALLDTSTFVKTTPPDKSENRTSTLLDVHACPCSSSPPSATNGDTVQKEVAISHIPEEKSENLSSTRDDHDGTIWRMLFKAALYFSNPVGGTDDQGELDANQRVTSEAKLQAPSPSAPTSKVHRARSCSSLKAQLISSNSCSPGEHPLKARSCSPGMPKERLRSPMDEGGPQATTSNKSITSDLEESSAMSSKPAEEDEVQARTSPARKSQVLEMSRPCSPGQAVMPQATTYVSIKTSRSCTPTRRGTSQASTSQALTPRTPRGPKAGRLQAKMSPPGSPLKGGTSQPNMVPPLVGQKILNASKSLRRSHSIPLSKAGIGQSSASISCKAARERGSHSGVTQSRSSSPVKAATSQASKSQCRTPPRAGQTRSIPISRANKASVVQPNGSPRFTRIDAVNSEAAAPHARTTKTQTSKPQTIEEVLQAVSRSVWNTAGMTAGSPTRSRVSQARSRSPVKVGPPQANKSGCMPLQKGQSTPDVPEVSPRTKSPQREKAPPWQKCASPLTSSSLVQDPVSAREKIHHQGSSISIAPIEDGSSINDKPGESDVSTGVSTSGFSTPQKPSHAISSVSTPPSLPPRSQSPIKVAMLKPEQAHSRSPSQSSKSILASSVSSSVLASSPPSVRRPQIGTSVHPQQPNRESRPLQPQQVSLWPVPMLDQRRGVSMTLWQDQRTGGSVVVSQERRPGVPLSTKSVAVTTQYPGSSSTPGVSNHLSVSLEMSIRGRPQPVSVDAPTGQRLQ